MTSSTKNSVLIHASREKVYRAFTEPAYLEKWLAPQDMTARVHSFDLREGGGYEMSLMYHESDHESQGKTAGKEDRFVSTFNTLIPYERIIQTITFVSDDPAFEGEMIMDTILDPVEDDTQVTMIFSNIPSGIRPEDNEAGTADSLKKLKKLMERS